MSGIGGKVRENNFEQELVVGLAEVKVVAINPTLEEYKETLGIELKEDSKAANYLGESKEGNTTLRLDVWVETVKSKKKYKITYFLENKKKENKIKEGEDKAKKYQYINEIGSTSWAEDENDLQTWFKKKDYRVAFVGEEELYSFMRAWLSKLDYTDPSTQILVDWKTLMKGNTKELRAQINGAYASTFVPLFGVKNVEKEEDGGVTIKKYQTIYNKAFLPTYAFKSMRLVDYDDEANLAKLQAKEERAKIDKTIKLGAHERFVLAVKGAYGCKDSFVLKDLTDYDPSKFLESSEEPIMSGSDDLPF